MTDNPLPDVRPDVPHGARIWNYWLGGKDNYAADREIGDAVSAVFPEIAVMAFKSRQFLSRAVRYLAGEAGIRQFLDIGTGLPTMQNTHEVAQAVAPDARIVYVDNDPLVLAHARALLVNTTAEGLTKYIDADYREPDRIIAEAREILDFTQPIAVMFMGVFGYVPDYDEVSSIISRVVDAVPSGSYLALWDGHQHQRGRRQGRAGAGRAGIAVRAAHRRGSPGLVRGHGAGRARAGAGHRLATG